MFGKRVIVPTVIIGLIYLSFLLATAGVAQLQLLAAGAPSGASSLAALVVSAVLSLAVPVGIATGLTSALVLRAYRIRSWAAYLANAVVSAMLGAYAFSYNFGIADNLGAILIHLPKKDAPLGFVYEVPPFSDTLVSALHSVSLIWQEWQFMLGVDFVALVIAAIFGGIFWSLETGQAVVSKTT